MRIPTRIAAVAAALWVSAGICQAQEIEWTQTIDLPKGLNLPQGVKADILGIELGAPYAEARKQLEAIQAESPAPESEKQIEEGMISIRLPVPGGSILASYVGQLRLRINRYSDSTPPQGHEIIEVVFSAPSSGHQVIGVKRIIDYQKQEGQIRISELATNLKAKFKSEPAVFSGKTNAEYRFVFDNGQPNNPPDMPIYACPVRAFGDHNSNSVKTINDTGACDVVLKVNFRKGISDDHARTIEFWLSDNERAQQNLVADFAFFNGYAKSVQQRKGGAAPKL